MPGRDGASAVFSDVLENTPLGPLAVWVTRNGVRRVGYVQRDMIEESHSDPASDATLALALRQLREYLEGRRKGFDLPLDFSGATTFQRRIFERLIHIPYGRILLVRRYRRRAGRSGRGLGRRPGRGSQSAPHRRAVPPGGPERRKAGRILGGTAPQGHPPWDRGCGR
jgi:methylated-DNA-[protein]-cysteine S-methyltransferase